jgi:hypothetical protein
MKAKIAAYDQKQVRRMIFAMDNWGLDTVAAMRAELERVKAFDLGMLYAATTKTPAQLTGTIIRVIVYNPMEYAVIVEFGRLPGKPPPLIPLVAWAVRHNIISNLPVNVSFEMYAKEWAASAAILRHMGHGSGGGSSGKKQPIDPVTLDLLRVRLIARKIAESGIAGRHPFSIAWERRAATFKQDIASMLQ